MSELLTIERVATLPLPLPTDVPSRQGAARRATAGWLHCCHRRLANYERVPMR